MTVSGGRASVLNNSETIIGSFSIEIKKKTQKTDTDVSSRRCDEVTSRRHRDADETTPRKSKTRNGRRVIETLREKDNLNLKKNSERCSLPRCTVHKRYRKRSEACKIVNFAVIADYDDYDDYD